MLPDATLPVPASLLGLLTSFGPLFTAPSFRTFTMLACGLLAQTGRRTVCGMLGPSRGPRRPLGRDPRPHPGRPGLPNRRITIGGHRQRLGELTYRALRAWLDYGRAIWPRTPTGMS
jgi:hypothetical protein